MKRLSLLSFASMACLLALGCSSSSSNPTSPIKDASTDDSGDDVVLDSGNPGPDASPDGSTPDVGSDASPVDGGVVVDAWHTDSLSFTLEQVGFAPQISWTFDAGARTLERVCASQEICASDVAVLGELDAGILTTALHGLHRAVVAPSETCPIDYAGYHLTVTDPGGVQRVYGNRNDIICAPSRTLPASFADALADGDLSTLAKGLDADSSACEGDGGAATASGVTCLVPDSGPGDAGNDGP
jgi:hypothetical protein